MKMKFIRICGGYKYFGFGGLAEARKGLKPFEGTAPGNGTSFNLFLSPVTEKAFRINVWIDGPWANETWEGKQIGTIEGPAGQTRVPEVTARTDNKDVRIEITQPESVTGTATVKCTYKGIVKTYTVLLSE